MSDPRDLTDGELDSIQILALAEIIREVDGNHSLGAAALAEAILRHPGSRWGRPSPAPAEASAAPTWPANFTRSKRAAQARRLCIAANLPESSPIVNRITREAANGLSLKDVVDLIASESSEPGVSAPVSATQRHPAPVLVAPYREIADLVVWLEDHSAECLELDRSEWAKSIAKAARFLHLYLKAAPVPVAVSERLPGAEERGSDECCWWFHPETDDTLPVWVFGYGNDEWERENPPSPTHWLPAHALPLPAGEVEQ